MKISYNPKVGFTLVETKIMIVLSIVGLLAAIAIPNFIKERKDAHQKECISNLRQLERLMQMWQSQNHKQTIDIPEDDDLFGPDKHRGKPVCPSGGVYDFKLEASGGMRGMPVKITVTPVCSLATKNGHVLPPPKN